MEKNEVPKEIKLLPIGEVKTDKGVFKMSVDDANETMSRYRQKSIDMHFDYDHASLRKDRRDGDGGAAGWFDLSLKNDGIYATNIRWTKKAEEAIKNKEWRYFSPAFLQKDGHIKQIVNVALTNIPATNAAEAIIAATSLFKEGIEKPMDNNGVLNSVGVLSSVRRAINELEVKLLDLHKQLEQFESQTDAAASSGEELDTAGEMAPEAAEDMPADMPGEDAAADGASAPETTEASETSFDGSEDAAGGEDNNGDYTSFGDDDDMKKLHSVALSLTGAETIDGAIIGLQRLHDNKSVIDELQAKIASYEAALADSKVKEKQELLSSGISLGKITPAQKEWAETLSNDQLKSYLNCSPARIPTAATAAKPLPSKQKQHKQPEIATMLEQLGLTEEEFMKQAELIKSGDFTIKDK